MAVVMSGQFGYWMSVYQGLDDAMDLATSDLNVPVVKQGLDRGAYALEEANAVPNAKPVFGQMTRSDPNNPIYQVTDHRYNPIANYTVDSNGHVLYRPAAVAFQGDWYSGSAVASGTGGATPNFTTTSYVWHPDAAGTPGEQVYFGRSFYLPTLQPNPDTDTQTSGRIYVVADNSARVFVNGTFIGNTTGWDPAVAPPDGESFRRPTEMLVPASVLKQGENILTIEASNDGGPAGLSVVADIGGIDGRGGLFGGVSLTTRTDEQRHWSVSRRSPNGFAGQIDFELRSGASMAYRQDDINRLQSVMTTLHGLLAGSGEREKNLFNMIR